MCAECALRRAGRQIASPSMGCRGMRCSIFHLCGIFFAALVFLLAGFFSGGFLGSAFGQEPPGKTIRSISQPRDPDRDGDQSYPYHRRDPSRWNWNQRGRTVPAGRSAAELRFRAYQQKMAMRRQRAASTRTPSSRASFSRSTHPPKQSLGGALSPLTPMNVSPSESAVWVPVGPAPLASDATGNGGQDYNWVSGRATSVLIDPADTTGNTVLLGGAYGGFGNPRTRAV
jgi:hypothetical protein